MRSSIQSFFHTLAASGSTWFVDLAGDDAMAHVVESFVKTVMSNLCAERLVRNLGAYQIVSCPAINRVPQSSATM